MSEREISWGDEELVEEEVISAVPAVAAPIEKEKKEKTKAPLPIPEWSIDKRADLPAESTPSWPEEPETVNNTNYNGNNNERNFDGNNFDDQPPLMRRPGRGNPRGEPSRESREPREPRETREPREPRESREPREPRRNKYNDISSLNLPGVDLSKMPQATTRLSFSNNNSNNSNQPSNDLPRRESFNSNNFENERDKRDVYERVNRITKEIDDLGWGEPAESEPVRVSPPVEPIKVSQPQYSAPVKVSNETGRLEDDGWGEPVEPEPVRASQPVEPIRASQPAEPVRVSQPQYSAPVKVSNETGRLEDDGWGDEPEEPVLPVKVAEPVKPVESVKVTEPVKPVESVKVTEPVTVSSAPAPVAAVPHIPLPQHFQPPQQSQAQPQPQAQPHQMPFMMPAAYPYMMSNPMSPVGQVPAPMSCMPGMMVPIWVTCPFCYHCYMYPPIAPGSGPAPGIANVPQTATNQ